MLLGVGVTHVPVTLTRVPTRTPSAPIHFTDPSGVTGSPRWLWMECFLRRCPICVEQTFLNFSPEKITQQKQGGEEVQGGDDIIRGPEFSPIWKQTV